LLLPDGHRVVVGSKPVVLGRLPECEVVLTDPNVSRRHAQVRRGETDDSYVVADMGSTNGTKLNGAVISGPQRLRDGDQITLGATAIRFERP
jgi:pSer/pThr/pTyr-binding forkhead associated (FHA) protein